MGQTTIEWVRGDDGSPGWTINPFRFRNLATGKVGHHCDKISPGCKNCYSSAMQAGPYLSGLTFIEENKPKGEFFLDENALQQVLRRKKPARIFWVDMSDMFLADYPDEWIDRCFAVMALTPQHTHMVLTKRADRMREYVNGRQHGRMCDVAQGIQIKGEKPNAPFPLPNVWLGVSVEDQPRKDRIELLRQTPAAVRFLSLEPLLEDLGELDLRGIDLAIIGGESGPEARPMDLAWARNIVQQCRAAGTKCFVKQLGAKPFDGHSRHKQIHDRTTDGNLYLHLDDRKGGAPEEWPEDLRIRQFPQLAR